MTLERGVVECPHCLGYGHDEDAPDGHGYSPAFDGSGLCLWCLDNGEDGKRLRCRVCDGNGIVDA